MEVPRPGGLSVQHGLASLEIQKRRGIEERLQQGGPGSTRFERALDKDEDQRRQFGLGHRTERYYRTGVWVVQGLGGPSNQRGEAGLQKKIKVIVEEETPV